MGHLVTISGTSRPDNYTSKALGVVTEHLRAKGREVVFLDGRDLTLGFPGHPETTDATRLREAVVEADGVVLATPEYHGSFAAMTKLIVENLGFPSVLKGKPVALLGVAAGRIGAIKSLEQLRGMCAHTGALVVPTVISIAGVRRLFDDDGQCTDQGTEQALEGLGDALLSFVGQYVCPRLILEETVRNAEHGWATST